ncbi:protein NDNF [Anopheles maculipalpis]|uniref:protein NDNF n=1 Tax=Anopheles maculipalpis TaxID=1496333 RepID=UPI002159B4B8|nr:protein NDNF [Anopheles maculipalpis]
MSTGVVSLAVVAVVVVSSVMHVLLLTSAFVGTTAEGAVRGADRHGFTSAIKSTIDRQGLAPATYSAAGHRRGAKNYACLQDLTQTVVPPGPEHTEDRPGNEARLLVEDRTVVLGEDEVDADIDADDIDTGSGTNVSSAALGRTLRRYSFRLLETSPLSITVTTTCSRKDDPLTGPRWWVLYEGRYIGALANGSQFFRSCVQRGVYQVVVDTAGYPVLDGCTYRLGYNRKGVEEFRSWPFRNLSAPSRIKVQQQRRRYVVMIKWEKSKLDIHVMNYCLAVSTGRRQRTLCQALGNSIHRPSCDTIAVNDFLHRFTPRDERKLDSGVDTTIVCTGTRTRQLIRGMKPNVTYYVDVFAIHSQHNNLSFLLGSTQVQLNRTRPTQLLEGKIVVGKLSTLGGISLFNFKVPKRSPNNFFKLHLTPCGGTVSLEVLKKKRRIMEPVRDVYYPRTITVRNVRPGERYLIRVHEADDTSRLNRIQVAVSSRDDFLDLPRMPLNSTVMELVSLRKCHSSTIVWFGSPDKDVTYCVYVFKLPKTQYYINNVKIPTYCELDSRDVCNHPQFHNKHCFNHNQDNLLSLDINNLLPEHYYTVFVTASSARGRSLPYKSIRIKTAPYCLESNQILPMGAIGSGKGAIKTVGFRKAGGQKRRNTAIATKNSLSERGTLKRSRKQKETPNRNV